MVPSTGLPGWIDGNLTLNEGQNLDVTVDTDHPWRSREAHPLQVPKQGMDRGRPRPHSTANRRAASNHAVTHSTTREQHVPGRLVFGT